MTQKRKARVGDTIRHNGKNPAYKAGEEFVVTKVVDQRFVHPYPLEGQVSTYWVGYNHPDPESGSAWELQFDIVEPAPEFKKGDRVKLTPKNGAQTVIYGDFCSTGFRQVWVVIEGDVDWGSAPFQTSHWNVELVAPTTEEILNGLGRNAYVALRDDPDGEYYPYAKIEDHWYLIDQNLHSGDVSALPVSSAAQIASCIDNSGFEIIFEGVKDE